MTEHQIDLDARAELGLSGGGGTSPLRRLLGKLFWPFLRHQVALNHLLVQELESLRGRLAGAEHELSRARGDIEHHTSVLVRHEEPLDRHEFLLGHLEPAFLDLQRAVDLVHDKVDLGQRQAFARYYEGIGPIQSALGALSVRLADLEVTQEERGVGWRGALSEVWLRLSQLDLFLTEARRSFPGPPAPERLAEIPSGFDGMRAAFEDAFRGPVSVIEERARGYVADLRDLTCGGPVLDLGCGRGELLFVLGEAGIDAYGVDASSESVARCKARGLDARHEDARAHLGALEERSLAAVTGIHLVEHLSPEDLLELLALAARVVRPGGLLILETPNPENVVVASSSFYLDPSHRRPLPPELLAFAVGSRGFDCIEVRRFERAEQAEGVARPKPEEGGGGTLEALVEVVNAHLFAPADYAVLARRP